MYLVIIFFSAILWLLITIILFVRLMDINSFFKTSHNRYTKEGVSDLLQYSTIIEDRIILLKNGSLLTSLMYVGGDLSTLDNQGLSNATNLISSAIAKLGSGWSINFDTIRTEALSYSNRSSSFFPNEVAFAIDEERRTLFNSKGVMYKSVNIISITYAPPLQNETKFIDMMYTDNSEKQSVYQRNINIFKQEVERFISLLSNVFKIERLGSSNYVLEDRTTHKMDSQLESLNYCITGKSQPIAVPKCSIPIDLLIGGEDLITGIVPRIGENYISCISIDGFPAESYPTILLGLSEMAIDYRFSTRYICIDSYLAEKQLNKIMKKWKQQQVGMFTTLLSQPQTDSNTNHYAVAMTNDALEGLTLQKNEDSTFGYYSATIVLMDTDKLNLKENSIEIVKLISALGFNARIETLNCFEAYLGTFPGHNVENIRRYFVSSLNLGDLIPKHTIYTGHETAPCDKYAKDSPPLMEVVTTGNTPYHFNLHVADVGHTLIVGPTGAGKSTLLAMIVAQAFRYKDASVYVFDKGMSIFALTKAFDGNHFELGSNLGSDLNFAPFNYIDTLEDRQWLVGFVERLLKLNGVIVNSKITASITNAITTLHQEKIHSTNPNLQHSITEFSSQLQCDDDADIQSILNLYDVSGAYGGYLSSVNDNLELSTFCSFEIEKLLNLDDKIKLLIFDYLFRRIDLMLKGQPAFVIIDEAWVAFKNPVFADQILEWLKVFRKRNCSVVLATQNINDMVNTGTLFTELINSTSSKIFLPNSSASQSEFSKVYKLFGLNEQQIRIISRAIPKKQYYHFTEEGARLFELSLGKLALSLVTVSDMKEIKNIKEYIRKDEKSWIRNYLLDKDINLDDFLKNYKVSMEEKC